MQKQIDIIIPAYNAHNTIQKTLASIANQIDSDEVKVTIVNDCSNKDYSNIIVNFKDMLDIQEITLKTRHGCGLTRNEGLNNTFCPYIMFIDADDLLNSPFTISQFLDIIKKEPNLNVVYGTINEINTRQKIEYYHQPTHCTWIFGSIYKRAFLNEFNIRFPDNSRGEDVAFNKIIKLLSPMENVKFISNVTYLWTDLNEKNRINTEKFKMETAKIGYIDNVLFAYDFVKDKKSPFPKNILRRDYIANLVSMYLQFLESIQYNIKLKDKMIAKAKEYYDLYEPIYGELITKKDIKETLDINIPIFCNGKNIKFSYTFEEYVDMLKG